jgi:hypothetical protein
MSAGNYTVSAAVAPDLGLDWQQPLQALNAISQRPSILGCNRLSQFGTQQNPDVLSVINLMGTAPRHQTSHRIHTVHRVHRVHNDEIAQNDPEHSWPFMSYQHPRENPAYIDLATATAKRTNRPICPPWRTQLCR